MSLTKVKNTLTNRTIVVAICSILVNGIAMFTAPIFTRLLSTADYGVFSVFMSWTGILSIVLGMQTHGSMNNGKIEFSEKKYKQYCADIYNLSLVAFVIGCIVVWGLESQLSDLLELPQELMILLVVNSLGSYVLSFITGYLTIEEKVVHSLVISVTYTLLTTILSIVLIYYCSIPGYKGRIWGYTLPHVFLIIYTFIYFNRFSCINNTIENCKFCLRLSLPLILHGLSGLVLNQSDRIMLLSLINESEAGIYSFCYTIALPVSIVYGALNSTWVPQYYIYMAQKKYEEIQVHYKRYMFLVVGITCGYILVSPEFVKILSVKEYWSGIDTMPLVIAAYFFNFLYLFPANYEFYLKNTKYIAVSSVVSAVCNIVLNYILIPKMGMFGAAIATIASFIIMFEMHDFVARYIIKDYIVKRSFYYKGIIPVIVCIILYYFIKDSFLLRWGLACVVGSILLIKIIKQKALI